MKVIALLVTLLFATIAGAQAPSDSELLRDLAKRVRALETLQKSLEVQEKQLEARREELESEARELHADRQQLAAERKQMEADAGVRKVSAPAVAAPAAVVATSPAAPLAVTTTPAPEPELAEVQMDEVEPPSTMASLTQLPEWVDRLRISGNADIAYFKGERNSLAPDGGRFLIDNARLFFDVGLGEDLRLGDQPVIGDASFFLEWDIFREGTFKNKIGAVYARFDRLFGTEWANLRFGRMQIPFGEEYLRFGQARPTNPLFSFSAPAPYNWDEGLVFFFSDPMKRLELSLGVMDGSDEIGGVMHDVQVNGKLTWKPNHWGHFSLSLLRTGRLGSEDEPAESALEFGGTHATPFGSGTDVQSYQNGLPIDPDPNNELRMYAGEGDVILTPSDWGRLWLAYGMAGIKSEGDSSYNRTLLYWIAEGIWELRTLTPVLDPYYFAARYSGIGTFSPNEGYSLEAMNGGQDLGYNTRRVDVFSVGLGARVGRHVTFKLEYNLYDFDLIRGVSSALEQDAKDRSYFGIGTTVWF